jgi:lipopolysaccharide cholinephosphotransferase
MTEIQKVIYNIYLEVAKILKGNNIDYYANGGTCLGAVRHNGFIPWDDDLDIAVPIEQFDYMIDVLNEELPSYYSVRFIEHNDHYGNIFVKVIDERTTCIERVEYKYPDAFKGVFIDIMPLSGMPDNDIKRHFFCRMINVLRILNDIRRFDIDAMDLEWKRKLHPIIRRFDKQIPASYFANKWYELLKKYPFEVCNYTGYVWWYDVLRLVYRKEVFGQPTPYPFEDTIMYCPQDADALLKQQFGDYMKLPPVEKRIPLHRGVLDLDHSYHDYQEGKYLLYCDSSN